MGTLAELKARIATDLTRDDLTTQIASAVTDAIAFYARDRFWFNTSRSLTFSTVASQVAYSSSDLSSIPKLVRIDALFTPSGTALIPCNRMEPGDFDMAWGSGTSTGRPYTFTYVDQTIRLGPTPDAVYSMRLHAHYKLATASDSDTNAWTDDAEELIRTHAKMLLHLDVLGDDQAAARMQSKLPILLAALRAESSARLSTGIIHGTEF